MLALLQSSLGLARAGLRRGFKAACKGHPFGMKEILSQPTRKAGRSAGGECRPTRYAAQQANGSEAVVRDQRTLKVKSRPQNAATAARAPENVGTDGGASTARRTAKTASTLGWKSRAYCNIWATPIGNQMVTTRAPRGRSQPLPLPWYAKSKPPPHSIWQGG